MKEKACPLVGTMKWTDPDGTNRVLNWDFCGS